MVIASVARNLGGRDARNDGSCHPPPRRLPPAESLSPRLEDGGQGVVYFDIDGLERHYANEPLAHWRAGDFALRSRRIRERVTPSVSEESGRCGVLARPSVRIPRSRSG